MPQRIEITKVCDALLIHYTLASDIHFFIFGLVFLAIVPSYQSMSNFLCLQ